MSVRDETSPESVAAMLETLDAEAFGIRVPSLLLTVNKRIFEEHQSQERPFPETKVIRSRVTESQTISAVVAALQPLHKDAESFSTAFVAFYEVLIDLPLDTLGLYYRQALQSLAAKPVTGVSGWGSLGRAAESLLLMIEDPDAVWVPESKSDCIAERSLRERATTPQLMRPHVQGLLAWLADPNWPPYQGCWKQLARFPEVTVGPIGELLERERGDGGWVLNILEFVDACIPLQLWEELKLKIKAFTESSRGDEDEWEVAERAGQLVQKYDDWNIQRLNHMAGAS
ncbi:hypothetical protein TWF281_009759 [Arthrobotrys megalospora]